MPKGRPISEHAREKNAERLRELNRRRFPKLTNEQHQQFLKANVIITTTGCWEWQKFRMKPPRHYGTTTYQGKRWTTHRLAYFLWKGPIPLGMHVLHSCDNPPCCNPDHLRLGTHLENMSECRERGRYYYANLTHCKRGHPFDEKNTHIITTPGEQFGLRQCRACQLGHMRVKRGWPEHLAYNMNLKIPPGWMLDLKTLKVVPQPGRRFFRSQLGQTVVR